MKIIRSIKITSSLLIIATSLTTLSCKENSEKTEDVNEVQIENEKSATNDPNSELHEEEVKTTGMAAFEDEDVARAYQDYIALKEALVNTNTNEASNAATKLEASAPSEISSIAKQISSENDVNKQRELFSQITSKMEPLLEDKITSGEIYKLYCPMAFEGKGDYWFSDSKQIRNPYFGDKMLNCGRVEKTIN